MYRKTPYFDDHLSSGTICRKRRFPPVAIEGSESLRGSSVERSCESNSDLVRRGTRRVVALWSVARLPHIPHCADSDRLDSIVNTRKLNETKGRRDCVQNLFVRSRMHCIRATVDRRLRRTPPSDSSRLVGKKRQSRDRFVCLPRWAEWAYQHKATVSANAFSSSSSESSSTAFSATRERRRQSIVATSIFFRIARNQA